MGFTGEFYQTLKKQYILPILYNLFQKTEADRVPLSSFMRPALPHYQNETTSQENYRPIFLMNTEVKILKKKYEQTEFTNIQNELYTKIKRSLSHVCISKLFI